MLNATANMLNILLIHAMKTANRTLSLNLFIVAHLCIQLGRSCKYTQRYGLNEHSLTLDADFSCSEVCYKLLQQTKARYLTIEQ